VKLLEDVRIIALEQYGAGPFGTVHLADLGAEVIKIEDPRAGGDVGRYVPPYAVGEDSLLFETFNRTKKSLSLDVSTRAGREVFEDLVRTSNAVYSNLRGDVPAKMCIRYADPSPESRDRLLQPHRVRHDRAAYRRARLRLRAAGPGRWMSLTGESRRSADEDRPVAGRLLRRLRRRDSLLAGLHAARRDGVGGDCDVSLYDTAVSLLTYPATWHLNAGYEPARTRNSAHPSLVPFQAFEAADGWFVVGCAKEKFWQRLVVRDRAARPRRGRSLRHLPKPSRARRRAAARARRGVGAHQALPDRDRRAAQGHGAVRHDDPGGVRRTGPRHGRLHAGLRGDRARLDGNRRHPRQPHHVLLDHRPARHGGAEAAAAAEAGRGRAPHRARAD
jgi:hypothetical protein